MSSFLLMSCAKNNPKTYIISFDKVIQEAPEIDSYEITNGTYITQPEFIDEIISNEKTYLFDGWYVNDELFDFTQKIDSNVNLVAHWKYIQYYPGSLIDLNDYEYLFERSNSFIYIAKIQTILETIFFDHYYHNVLTRYSLEIETMLYKSVDYEDIYILGGEVEANIYKYFQYYPKPIELGKYYFIIDFDRDKWIYDHPVGISHIAGHSVIELFSYDPSKALDEQSEDVLAIIQPYLDAIEAIND
jgi:hypothetical protein